MLVTIHSTWRGVLQPPTRRVCHDYSQQEALWTLRTCDNALLCVNAPLFPATRLPGYRVTRSYKELSNCTRHVVQQLDCFWPNAEVDKFFLVVHQRYFRNCPVSGRALQDPPSSVLCPFIVVPILVTLLVTVLVVWRSKRPEGIV
ncbi:receptor activity-modifying protein 1 isoform X3 [Bubalus kerabau]|uniref:receptor activity-modifying protein 1 isoform X3 n=1 Tax=Bubalus carabanensis TaxID=3119969 RepID=UPI00244E8D36|nr:receptor activity-modifying protein 1 isoform X3 [Bubalus carabanensis]